MKKIILSLVLMICSVTLYAQSLVGAWERYSTSENGDRLRSMVIFAEGYQVFTTYDASTGKFIYTNGGSWKLEGDTMTEKVEFDTSNPENVGKEVSFQVDISEDEFAIVDHDMRFKRIDKGTPGKLQGAWLMSGRVREGFIGNPISMDSLQYRNKAIYGNRRRNLYYQGWPIHRKYRILFQR